MHIGDKCYSVNNNTRGTDSYLGECADGEHWALKNQEACAGKEMQAAIDWQIMLLKEALTKEA
jgi:hypothetical protein